MSPVTYSKPEHPYPDMPGLVHGIVGTNPWMVQCDGCGVVATGPSAGLAVLCGGINFNPRLPEDSRRLCVDCRKTESDATWRDDL